MPAANAAQQTERKCKPCKKEKDKRRNKCYKKMVEERVYKKWDREYKWQEIDCETGRPI